MAERESVKLVRMREKRKTTQDLNDRFDTVPRSVHLKIGGSRNWKISK